MPLLEDAVVRRAIDNVATWGDTDIFPFPIENHVIHDRSDDVAALIHNIAADFDGRVVADPVQNYATLAPVGYTGFRWATQIDPMWNVYLLSLVLSLAESIEEVRVPESEEKIFSYRYRPAETGSLFSTDGWAGFQRKTRELAEQCNYVVSVDIADFYSRIYHHKLENALHDVDKQRTRSRHIMKLLNILSNNTSYGLPVGGPAARILSELLLSGVDQLLTAEPATHRFCRYADDYRFFVEDLQAAYRAIGFLSEKLLRNHGLSLQKGKTRIMTSAEYISVLDPPAPPPGSAAKFLGLHVHFDPYSPTAEDDYERLKEQINEFDISALLRGELNKGRVHTALTRRLINSLRFMDELPRKQAVISLLENTETLAPVLPQVMLAVRSALDEISDPEFAEEAQSLARRLVIDSHYVAKIDLNLSYIVRVLAARRSRSNEQLLAQLYNVPHSFGGSVAPTVQRDIMLAMSRWEIRYWLSDQKNYISTAHAWVKRAFIVSSYTLGDEGRHWREANKTTFRPFELIIRDWAAQKAQQIGWVVPI